MTSVIPLPADIQQQGGDGLPLADELTVAYDQDGLRPVAEQLCEWITRRWGAACVTALCSSTAGGGGNSSGGDDGGGDPPLLLRRVRLQLQPQGLAGGTEAEAYTILAPAPAPGEAIVSAATLAGDTRGAGARPCGCRIGPLAV